MTHIKSILVGHPSRAVIEKVVGGVRRLAERCFAARTATEAKQLLTEHRPELAILSAQLGAQEIRRLATIRGVGSRRPLVIVTYAEMTPAELKAVKKADVADILPEPLQLESLYRAISGRFSIPVRRHPRFQVELDVLRLDGVLLGTTQNLSMGGLFMTRTAPLHCGDSLVIDLVLPTGKKVRARATVLEARDGPPTARLEFDNLLGESLAGLQSFLAMLEADQAHARLPQRTPA